MNSLSVEQLTYVVAAALVVLAVLVTYLVLRRNTVAIKQELLEEQIGLKNSQIAIQKLERELSVALDDKESVEQSERRLALTLERVQSELAAAAVSVDNLSQEKSDFTKLVAALQEERAVLNRQVSEAQTALTQNELSLTKQIALKEEQLVEYRERLAAFDDDLKRSQADSNAFRAELASLKSGIEEKERSFEAQIGRLTEQEAHIRKEFENLANKIFEEKGKNFNEQSRQTLNDLLHPFKLQMSEFKQKVEDIHINDVKAQATLSKELSDLKDLNRSMTEQAHNLATALQGQKKTQGNWGELLLENILDTAGLIRGRDYEREVSFNTEDGRSRPDAIVYLPQDKHLIIDAKVSLNAYTRYINSEDDNERAIAIKDHVSAVADRIKELSDRNYYQIAELNSPEMVFMFVPIESAFVEALKADETLFQKALEQNVLVATPTTLLTSLNIVKQLWRFEDQNKHTAEIAERAGKIYDKLNTFLGSMQGIGKQLDKAKEHYDKAFSQLYSGRGNLVKQVNDFKKLGVSVKTELAKDITDKAELELELLTNADTEELESSVSLEVEKESES